MMKFLHVKRYSDAERSNAELILREKKDRMSPVGVAPIRPPNRNPSGQPRRTHPATVYTACVGPYPATSCRRSDA